MHESVEFFRSTSLVDALSRFAYDGVSNVRCIFWEPPIRFTAQVNSKFKLYRISLKPYSGVRKRYRPR